LRGEEISLRGEEISLRGEELSLRRGLIFKKRIYISNLEIS